MEFKLPEFKFPDFSDAQYANLPEISIGEVEKDGVAPDEFYLTSHMPTFYKYNGKWILPEHNSLNCVAVLDGDKIVITELRELKKGDKLVL